MDDVMDEDLYLDDDFDSPETLEDDYDYEGAADRHSDLVERLERIEAMLESFKIK